MERAIAAGMLEGEVLGRDGLDHAGRAAARTRSSRSASAGGESRCGAFVPDAEQLGERGRVPAVDHAPRRDDGGDRRHAEAPSARRRADGSASMSTESNGTPHDESNSLVFAQELQPCRW